MNWWNFKTKHDLTSFLKVTITSVVLCTFRIDPVESAILKKVFFMIEVSNRRFQLKMCYVDITHFLIF